MIKSFIIRSNIKKLPTMNDSYVNDYVPPQNAPQSVQAADVSVNQKYSSESETLEDQNIFFLLGVETGSDIEKSQFLDDLQQVIWEDFLENDVSLLILDSENQKLREIIGPSSADLSVEKQEKIIEFLEEIVPDLEDIMVDKAVRLKADLVRERIASLKELYLGESDTLELILQAETHINEGKWATAARTLNNL